MLAALTLALSVYFSPSMALAVAMGIVGALVMTVPIASIFYLKTKEDVDYYAALEAAQAQLKLNLQRQKDEDKSREAVLKLKEFVDAKSTLSTQAYFDTYNKNYAANLKAIEAVNLLLDKGDKIFEEEREIQDRLISRRALARYATAEDEKGTAELFFERLKGKRLPRISINLKKGEKIDSELLFALSAACQIRINDSIFTREEMKRVVTIKFVEANRERIFEAALEEKMRLQGGVYSKSVEPAKRPDGSLKRPRYYAFDDRGERRKSCKI